MLQISLLCMHHLKPSFEDAATDNRLFLRFFSRNSQTTEGTSTSKTLQERPSRNLTLEFNRNYVCI